MAHKKKKDHDDWLETAVKISALIIVVVELARFILDYLVK
jgi:hypothetical protein